MTEGLWCHCSIPLGWKPAGDDTLQLARQVHEASLLLVAVNQMEAMRDMDITHQENRAMDRLEAKLDLALHLLARTLISEHTPPVRETRMSPVNIAWLDTAPPEVGTRIVLELYATDILPIALHLPAVVDEPQGGYAQATFDDLPDLLSEALYQFVFRRHRQAIRKHLAEVQG